jgi:hypothetical protein
VTRPSAELTARAERRPTLQTQLTAAEGREQAATPNRRHDLADRVADQAAHRGWQADREPADDVAALTAAIDAETKGLTALIPAGGASEGGTGETARRRPQACPPSRPRK